MRESFFLYNDVESLAQSIKKWFEISKDRNEIRENCYKIIDMKYNPYVQIEIIKNVLINKDVL